MKIAFIGLGIMGEAMCENILKKHDDTVYVYDVLPEKAQPLAQTGAVVCAGAAEAAQNADVIFSMVPKSEHSRQVYSGLLAAGVLTPGKICVDMSTIDPAVSRELAALVKQAGAQFLDAPVVKSRPAAEAGKLGIYVGGDEEAFGTVLPLLRYMGENVVRMGENGKGLVMKICHNALVAQIQNGVNETLALAAANGVPVEAFAEAISYGGGQNFYLDSKKGPLAREDYTTAFSIENMAKDLGICMALAAESGVSMPGGANAKRVYDAALAAGLGQEDFCATIKIVKGNGAKGETANDKNAGGAIAGQELAGDVTAADKTAPDKMKKGDA